MLRFKVATRECIMSIKVHTKIEVQRCLCAWDTERKRASSSIDFWLGGWPVAVDTSVFASLPAPSYLPLPPCLHNAPPPLLLMSDMCVWSAGCGVCLQHNLSDGKTPLLNTDGCSLACAGVFSSAVNSFTTKPTDVSNNLWMGGCKTRWFVPHRCLVPK